MNSIDKKICVCTLHNSFSPNEVGGVSSAPVYLYNQLWRLFDNIDIISMRLVKESNLSPIAARVIYYDDPTVLDKYDFVIFTTPGLTYEKYDERTPNKYVDILNHAKKFTFIFNEENDLKMYPYHKNFVYHPNLAFLTFNCPGMVDSFKEYVDYVKDWDYVSFSPVLPPKDVILERAKNKKNKIMSTCRWTTSKRIYEYLSMTEDFIKNGIEVFAAGAHQSYWYNLKMAELPSKNYTDLGYFEPSQIHDLLKDVKYHWNFLFQLRGMGQRTHKPRLEIATMEAIREGCLPVICKEFTPDWVGLDSAVRLSKNDYTSIPDVLGAMTDEERLARIDRLYDLVDENITKHYKDFAGHIASIL